MKSIAKNRLEELAAGGGRAGEEWQTDLILEKVESPLDLSGFLVPFPWKAT